jgi:hypothetical protein
MVTLFLRGVHGVGATQESNRTCSGGALSRVTILAEWLRYFNHLAVGETAAPACSSRENAEGAGMPPLLSH